MVIPSLPVIIVYIPPSSTPSRRILRTQSVDDLSFEGLVLMVTVSALWILHAHYQRDEALL